MTSTPRELRRRHLAALRTPPLACGHRDPIRCAVAPHGHSSYGLTVRELLAERSRLLTAGWTPGEVDARLNAREVIAA
ncbi:hypothetical protein [Streptomyces sp. RT42]|uniref:hypothetical protein n=1 Tax=Streptomyces sp. RT42 TaxID=2824898 RepID=UPI001B360A5B|nr:hypothetical protein [Streptomyces sp. RT42]MBQ0877466.1 hypothetical protein [Streptomyces sp. RT42]